MNRTENREVRDINLRETFYVLKKRFWIIVTFSLLSVCFGIIYNTQFNTILYQSSARIIVGADPELMKTLHVIITDPSILEKVIEEVELQKSSKELSEQISVESISGSQVVSINVVDRSPKIAAEIANSITKVFKEEVPRILGFNDIRLLSKAVINPYPINENNVRNIVVALVIGLVLGIGFVFLLDSFDITLRSGHEIEEVLGIPLIGKISKMSKKNIKKKSQYQMELNFRGETSVSK